VSDEGKARYDAYRETLGGRDLVTGDLLPEYEELNPKTRHGFNVGVRVSELAAVTAERDGLRKSLHAIEDGIAEPSPRTVATDALNGRYFDPETDTGVWDVAGTGSALPAAPDPDDDAGDFVQDRHADLDIGEGGGMSDSEFYDRTSGAGQ
jgi:hypothetical protein